MEQSDEETTKCSLNLPEGLQLYPLQLSGHRHGEGRLLFGILKHDNGNLMKPLIEGDQRAKRELTFYENILKNQFDQLIRELIVFLPAFHGTWETNISGKNIKYLCLEDVCKNFQNPSVLEIKMGCITYDDNATPEKIQSQSKKYISGESLGIRVKGIKIYDDEQQKYTTPKDKKFWKQLAPEDVISGLQLYLTGCNYINLLMLSGFIHKLSQLNDWFSKQRKIKLIGSSLLFTYEGTSETWIAWVNENDLPVFSKHGTEGVIGTEHLNFVPGEVCDVCGLCKSICSKVLNNCDLFRVAMIDFAHCHPTDKEDLNYIHGLRNLSKYFKKMMKIQLQL